MSLWIEIPGMRFQSRVEISVRRSRFNVVSLLLLGICIEISLEIASCIMLACASIGILYRYFHTGTS